MACKCGHPQWAHINRLGKERGPCCAEKKIDLRRVDAKTRQKLLDPYPKDKRYRILKRGKLITACNCPYYHEIELGQVQVLKPGDASVIKKPGEKDG